VFVRAQVITQVDNPFELFPQRQSTESTGSGFLIDHDGDILTNFHVIEGADRRTGVTVRFEDDIIRHAVVVGVDQDNDLAVLKADMRGLPSVRPLSLGDSSSVRVGDPTLAIGNPFGLDRTLTSGIVSALQRQIQAPNGFSIDNVIQTDAPINPGNSGGPLLNAIGRVIGINSQIATGGSDGSIGIAFAVPINTARPLVHRISTESAVRLAYLGVSGVPAPNAAGVVVQQANPGGPAASAGLKRGDVIKQVGGRPTKSMGDVDAVVEPRQPGDAVQVEVDRAGRNRLFTVTLGSQALPAP
jgi:putative serine protease PepD